MLSASSDETLGVWDAATGQRLLALEGHTGSVFSCSWSPDGTRVLSASSDCALGVWDAATGQRLLALEGHTGWVNSCSWSPDGTRVLSASGDETLGVWDAATGQRLLALEGHTGWVSDCSWSPDGTRALSASSDCALGVWDAATGQRLLALEGHTDWVRSCSWSPDGTRVLSASGDETLGVWDAATGQRLLALEGHTGSVNSCSWSPDGTRVLSASDDCTLGVWDAATGQRLLALEGHTDWVRDCSWSPDGTRVLTASDDQTLRIWMLGTGREAAISDDNDRSMYYKNAKVVLLGESGAGKSGLCQRLEANTWDSCGAWEETEGSTHGVHVAQIDLPPAAGGSEGRENREVWLWDFAGQPDYQIVNQLHLRDTALAALVFNPQDASPFDKLHRWDQRLVQAARNDLHEQGTAPQKILVAARTDRGGLIATDTDIRLFCTNFGYAGYYSTSAKTGDGMDAFRQALANQIPWAQIPGTLSTTLFRALKAAIVAIAKQSGRVEQPQVLMQEAALAAALAYQIPDQSFTHDELRTAIDLLARLGLTTRLGFGGLIAMDPASLNQYASAIVRQARKQPDGLGVIREADVLEAKIDLEGIDRLDKHQEQLMLQAVSALFIERGLCLADQTDAGRVLIFPSLYRRQRPESPTRPSTVVAYMFEGAEDHVYATLVVRLANTALFTKATFYQGAARLCVAGHWAYVTIDTSPGGQHRLEVSFEDLVDRQARSIFLRFVHDHVMERGLNVTRVRLYQCPACATHVPESRIAKRRDAAKPYVSCDCCDNRIEFDDLVEREAFSQDTGDSSRAETVNATRRIDTEAKGRQLHYHSGLIVTEANQIFRDLSESDYGIDAEIEFKDDSFQATGRRVYLQLKHGAAHIRRRARDNAWVFDIKKPRWAEYWAAHESPVMLVIKTDRDGIRWMDVRAPIRQHHNKTGEWPKHLIFNGEPFTALNVKRLREQLLTDAECRNSTGLGPAI